MGTKRYIMALSAAAALLAGPAVFAQEAASGGNGMSSSDPASISGGAQGGAMGGSAGAGAQADVKLSEQQVRDLQQSLKAQGHDIEVDGVWGPNTQAALRQFQQQQGLQATGQPNDETLAALGVTDRAVGAPRAGDQQPQPSDGMQQPGGTGGRADDAGDMGAGGTTGGAGDIGAGGAGGSDRGTGAGDLGTGEAGGAGGASGASGGTSADTDTREGMGGSTGGAGASPSGGMSR